MQTVRTNLVLGASSQYTNYNHTSMCRFNGMLLGAGPEGLFRINCTDTDNGTPIEAYFMPHLTDLGLPNPKSIEQIYVGYQCSGELQLLITGDESVTVGPYTLQAIAIKGQQRRRVTPGKGFSWTYASIKVQNVSGSNFAVDTIELLTAVKTHGVI